MIFDQLQKNLPVSIINHIIAVYIFGSTARGEQDEYSDYDIFLCINDCTDQEFVDLKTDIDKIYKDTNYEFSVYQLSTVKAMHTKGSYFLWHLKKEAIVLYDRNETIKNLLDTLPAYKNTFTDFEEYYIILQDIKSAVQEEDYSMSYELSILATLARNTCIGLCYLMNDMDFGRISPIQKCQAHFKSNFPFSLKEYWALYEFRLAENRKNINLCLMDIDSDYIISWIDKIEALLQLSKSICQVQK